MIYQEEIIVDGKLYSSVLSLNDVWRELGGFLKHRGHFGDFYDVNLGMMKKGPNDMGITKRLAYTEIDRELRLDEGMPSF